MNKIKFFDKATGEQRYPETRIEAVKGAQEAIDNSVAAAINSTPEQLAVINQLREQLSDDENVANAVTKAIAGKLDKKAAEQSFARKDGAYEGMLVGTAMNLQGQDESVNSSMARTSGGTADIGSGLAEVTAVRGNAVAWNSAFKQVDNNAGGRSWGIGKHYNDDFVTFENLGDSKISITINKALESEKTVNIHILNPDGDAYGVPSMKSSVYYATCNNNKGLITVGSQNGTNLSYSKSAVFKGGGYPRFIIKKGATPQTFTIQFTYIDLTRIYGAGKEPATAEEFEADYRRWFGKDLTFEPYDEGSIRNVKATALKTTGFNLSKVEKFEGTADEWYRTYGRDFANGGLWVNEFGYTGQMYLQCKIASHGSSVMIGFAYTDGTFKGEQVQNQSTPQQVTLLSDQGKVVKCVYGSYGTNAGKIEVSDICINFAWSGIRNGDYEPHWEESKSLPLTSLTGRLNGEGLPIPVFPDGMKRAGNVYDEIKVEDGVVKAIRRVGSVDLGTLEWEKAGESRAHIKNFNVATHSQSGWNSSTLLCGKYSQDLPYPKNSEYFKDKVIGMYDPIGEVYLSDSAMDANFETWKHSLAGVILYYELAEPQVFVIDDFELPFLYKVDDFGTEEIIAPEHSVAPSLLTKYSVNAVDTLRRLPTNYISIESMDNFLSKLSAAMGGTWSRQWDEQTGAYTFSFSPSTANINLLNDSQDEHDSN